MSVGFKDIRIYIHKLSLLLGNTVYNEHCEEFYEGMRLRIVVTKLVFCTLLYKRYWSLCCLSKSLKFLLNFIFYLLY